MLGTIIIIALFVLVGIFFHWAMSSGPDENVPVGDYYLYGDDSFLEE